MSTQAYTGNFAESAIVSVQEYGRARGLSSYPYWVMRLSGISAPADGGRFLMGTRPQKNDPHDRRAVLYARLDMRDVPRYDVALTDFTDMSGRPTTHGRPLSPTSQFGMTATAGTHESLDAIAHHADSRTGASQLHGRMARQGGWVLLSSNGVHDIYPGNDPFATRKPEDAYRFASTCLLAMARTTIEPEIFTDPASVPPLPFPADDER